MKQWIPAFIAFFIAGCALTLGAVVLAGHAANRPAITSQFTSEDGRAAFSIVILHGELDTCVAFINGSGYVSLDHMIRPIASLPDQSIELYGGDWTVAAAPREGTWAEVESEGDVVWEVGERR